MKKKILNTFLILSVQLVSIPVSPAYATTPEPISAPSANLVSSKITATIPTTPSLDIRSQSQRSAFVKRPFSVQKLAKKHFRSDEEICGAVNNAQDTTVTAEVFDSEDKKADVEITSMQNMDQLLFDIEPRTQFRPGEYTVVVSGTDGTRIEQDFTWGVLAINTNKSLYHPGETADLAIGRT